MKLRAGEAEGQEKRGALGVSWGVSHVPGQWDSCLGSLCYPVQSPACFHGTFFSPAINTASQFVVCVRSAAQSGVVDFVTPPKILLSRAGNHSSTLLRGEVRRKRAFAATRLGPSVPIAPLRSSHLGNDLFRLTQTSALALTPAPLRLGHRVLATGGFCTPARCLAPADSLFCIFI